MVIKQWNHCAVVISAGTATLYLNGAKVSTATAISAASTSSVSTYIVGASNSVYLNGYISNLRVVKGTALYTTPFVPTWSPLTPVANTVLLTAQTNLSSNTKVFVDESNLNSIVTGFGNATLGSFSPFGSSWSGYFDGANDYLAMPTSSSFNFGTGDFTVECWVNWSSTTTDRGIISRYAGASSGWALRYDNTSGPTLNWINGDTSILIASHTPIAGTWYHYAVCRSGTTLRIFINGTQSASTTYSGNQDNSSTLYIGQLSNTLWPVNGYISNVRILKGTALYTAAFTPSTNPLLPVANTVLLTCNSNKFVDYSAANNVITKGGDGASTVSKFSPFSSVTVTPASYSGYFDGTGDYLSVPSNANLAFGTGDFTVEAWVYWSSIAAPRPIINMQSSGSFNLYWDSGAFNANSIVVSNRIANQIIYSFVPVIGTWYHIAVSRSGTNLRLFVNGTLVSTAASNTTDYAAGISHIGGDTGTSWYHNGYISNLRAVKGTAVYTSEFTPSTTPLTAIANTSLLTCQSTTFIDNSNNAFTITRNGDAKPVIQNPFTDTIGTASNYSANTYGNSIYFDGTTDYLTAAYSPNFNIPASTPFTIEGWAYTTATTEFHFANRNWSYGGSGPTYAFYLASGTTPSWGIAGTGSSTYTMMVAGLPGPLRQWNHYAWTRDASNVCRIFTNGVEAVSSTRTDSQALTSSSGNMFIGVSSNLASNYTNGYLSGLRFIVGSCLYNSSFVPPNQPAPVTSNTTLLLASTVGPSVTDAIRISNMETFGTARYVANNSPYYDTYSGYFDGSGDYLTLAANAAFGFGTGDFTVEMWIYPTSTKVTQFLFDTRDSGASTGTRYALALNNTTSMQPIISVGTGTIVTSSQTVAINSWYHIAFSKASGTVRLFINGIQVGSVSSAIDVGASSGPAIGTVGDSRGSYDGYFAGYISNLRVVKGTALYTSTFTPSTTPLTAVANTSLLTCQSNRFIDNSTNAFTITKVGDAKITTLEPFVDSNNSRFSSVYFGTKTDYLAVRTQPSLITFPGDFTFECWVYPTSTTLSTAWGIWDNRQSGGTAAAMNFGLAALASPVTGSWRLTYYNGTSYYGTGTVLWNQWTHVAWVRSGTTMTFYVNGVAGGTATISGTQTGTATTNPVYIGTKDNGLSNYGTVGYIADFRITNGYARTITVPTAPYDIK